MLLLGGDVDVRDEGGCDGGMVYIPAKLLTKKIANKSWSSQLEIGRHVLDQLACDEMK